MDKWPHPDNSHDKLLASPNLMLTLPHEDTVDAWLEFLKDADALTLIHIERIGFNAALIRSLADRLDLPIKRVYCIVGLPGAGNKKSISGISGLATLGLLRLIQQVQDILVESGSEDAKDFSGARWLGTWIECPIQTLGNRRPADFLDTPTGSQLVTQMIASIQSGTYL